MEIKETNAIEVFAYEMKTTLKTMVNEVGDIPGVLMTELGKQGINPTGPQIWSYESISGECVGNPDEEILVGINIPVEKKGSDVGSYKFKNLLSYKFVQKTHKGPYSKFPEFYGKFIDDIDKEGLELEGSARECYINCDFENQDNCITDIQIAIK